MRPHRLLRPAVALLGLVAAGACLKVPQQSASLGAMEATEVNATELQMRVYAWARLHPIEGSGLGRESLLSSNWKVLSVTESSLTGTVASVQRSLAGVNLRLGYINEGVYKRVLWQTELAAADMMPVFLSLGRTAMDSLFTGRGQHRPAFDRSRRRRHRLLPAVDLPRDAGARGRVWGQLWDCVCRVTKSASLAR